MQIYKKSFINCTGFRKKQIYSHLIVEDGPFIDIKKDEPNITKDDINKTPILISNIYTQFISIGKESI